MAQVHQLSPPSPVSRYAGGKPPRDQTVAASLSPRPDSGSVFTSPGPDGRERAEGGKAAAGAGTEGDKEGQGVGAEEHASHVARAPLPMPACATSSGPAANPDLSFRCLGASGATPSPSPPHGGDQPPVHPSPARAAPTVPPTPVHFHFSTPGRPAFDPGPTPPLRREETGRLGKDGGADDAGGTAPSQAGHAEAVNTEGAGLSGPGMDVGGLGFTLGGSRGGRGGGAGRGGAPRRRDVGKKLRINGTPSGPKPLASELPPPPATFPASVPSSFPASEASGRMPMDLSDALQREVDARTGAAAAAPPPPVFPTPPQSSTGDGQNSAPETVAFSLGAASAGLSPSKPPPRARFVHHRSRSRGHARGGSSTSTGSSDGDQGGRSTSAHSSATTHCFPSSLSPLATTSAPFSTDAAAATPDVTVGVNHHVGGAPAPQLSSPLQGKEGFDLWSSCKGSPSVPVPPFGHGWPGRPREGRGTEGRQDGAGSQAEDKDELSGHQKVGSDVGVEQETDCSSSSASAFALGGHGANTKASARLVPVPSMSHDGAPGSPNFIFGSEPTGAAFHIGEDASYAGSAGKSVDEGRPGEEAGKAPRSSAFMPAAGGKEEIFFSLGSSKTVTPTKGGGSSRTGSRHLLHSHARSASAGFIAKQREESPGSPLFGQTGSTSHWTAAGSGAQGPSGGPMGEGKSPGIASPSSAATAGKLPPPYDTQRELQHAAQTFREKASSLYLTKHYEESLHEFSNALLLAPDGWLEKPKLFCNRAAALIMIHRYEDAVKDCEKAIKGDRHLLKAYTRCGRAYLHMGVLERAYACFDEVRRRAKERLLDKFGPDVPPIPPSSGASTHVLHQQRVAAHEKKSLEEAVREAEDGQAEVQAVEGALQAAEQHFKRVEWPEALDRVEAALRFAHRAKRAMRLKLVALCKLKRWEEGVRFSEKYYASNKAELLSPVFIPPTSTADGGGTSPSSPGDANPHAPVNVILRMDSLEQRSYIRCLRYTDREDDALAALKSLLSHHGHVMWVSKELVRIQAIRRAKEAGDAAFREQKFEAALAHYGEALKLDPEWDTMNAVLHCNRGAAHMALRLFEKAKEDCTHALRKKPDYWKAFLRRARAWREMKRWGESIFDYETYLKHAYPAGGGREDGREAGNVGASVKGSVADVQSELESVRIEMQVEKERRDFAKRQQQQHDSHWRGGGRPWRHGKGRKPGYRVSSPFEESSSEEEEEEEDVTGAEDEEDADRAGVFRDFFEYYRRHQKEAEPARASGPHNGPAGSFGRSASSSSYSSNRRAYNFSNTKRNAGSNANGSGAPGPKSSRPLPGWGRSRSTSSVPHSGSNVSTHYSVLGIGRVASSGEVKKAYHRLALRFHPDKNKEAGAEEMFKKVSEAYNVLSDNSARRVYDAELRVGGGGI